MSDGYACRCCVQIADSSQLQKWEVKELFKEYIEDYNTATLPHEKYINHEKWEMEEWESECRRTGDSHNINSLSNRTRSEMLRPLVCSSIVESSVPLPRRIVHLVLSHAVVT